MFKKLRERRRINQAWVTRHQTRPQVCGAEVTVQGHIIRCNIEQGHPGEHYGHFSDTSTLTWNK